MTTHNPTEEECSNYSDKVVELTDGEEYNLDFINHDIKDALERGARIKEIQAAWSAFLNKCTAEVPLQELRTDILGISQLMRSCELVNITTGEFVVGLPSDNNHYPKFDDFVNAVLFVQSKIEDLVGDRLEDWSFYSEICDKAEIDVDDVDELYNGIRQSQLNLNDLSKKFHLMKDDDQKHVTTPEYCDHLLGNDEIDQYLIDDALEAGIIGNQAILTDIVI